MGRLIPFTEKMKKLEIRRPEIISMSEKGAGGSNGKKLGRSNRRKTEREGTGNLEV